MHYRWICDTYRSCCEWRINFVIVIRMSTSYRYKIISIFLLMKQRRHVSSSHVRTIFVLRLFIIKSIVREGMDFATERCSSEPCFIHDCASITPPVINTCRYVYAWSLAFQSTFIFFVASFTIHFDFFQNHSWIFPDHRLPKAKVWKESTWLIHEVTRMLIKVTLFVQI